MEIKKINDTYAMDIEGQKCPGLNEECCYDCAHWKIIRHLIQIDAQ